MTPLRLNIRIFREAKGWTVRQLAEEAGVRAATISDMENREAIQRLDVPALEAIAKALGVKAQALLSEEQPEPPARR